MKHIPYQCILLVMIVLLTFLLPACKGTPASAVQYSDINSKMLDLPPEFVVGPLSIQRAGATIGEPITVKTTVTNIGDKEGDYMAILYLDGKEISRREVSLKAKSSEDISFLLILGVAGKKTVAVGDSTAIVAAYRWPYAIMYDSDTRMEGRGYEHGPQSYGTGPAMTPPISITGGYGHMVRFSPPAVPFRIQMLLINGEASLKSKADWENTMEVRIWNDARNLLWSMNLPWRFFRYPREWNHVDVPNIVVQKDFFVEIVTHSGANDNGVLDVQYFVEPPEKGIYLYWDKPHSYLVAPMEVEETRSSISYMGVSVEVPIKYQGINWYIRAIGDGSLPAQ